MRRHLHSLTARLFLACAVTALPAAPSPAEEMRAVAVHFPPGQTGTVLRDRITGYDSVLYRIGAEAGQRLRVALVSPHGATYFNVYPPGSGPGDDALAASGTTGPMVPELNRFDGTLPASGEYTVSVYMMRSAARRNEVAPFTLDVSVTGAPGAQPQADYADGLQGGPDFWRVLTSDPAGQVNLRAGASAGAAVVMALPNGQPLRNLGCRMAEGRRWCRVAVPEGPEGWAAGDFLVEGPAPQDPPDPEPATHDQQVRFAPGASGVQLDGRLGPGEAMNYHLGARAGQRLSITLAPGTPQVHFNLFAADGSLRFQSAEAGVSYSQPVDLDGELTVTVYNLGEATWYEMGIGIE